MRKQLGEGFAKKHGIKIGFMSPFVKASAYALMDQPVVNAVIDGQDIVYRDYVDISVAVATPKVDIGMPLLCWKAFFLYRLFYVRAWLFPSFVTFTP